MGGWCRVEVEAGGVALANREVERGGEGGGSFRSNGTLRPVLEASILRTLPPGLPVAPVALQSH